MENSSQLNSLLETADRELRSGRGEKERYMERVRDFISRSGNFSISDVLKLAENLKARHQKVQSLIVFYISYDLFIKQNVSPDFAAKWISQLIFRISILIAHLIDKSDWSCDIEIQ